MNEGESIMRMTPEEAIDVYENSAISIAMTLTKSMVDGREFDEGKVLKASMDLADSFREFILSHSRFPLGEEGGSKFHYAACTMLWMDRVHRYIESEGRERFPEGPLTFLNHVSAYAILTEQDWSTACEELLKQGASE